MRVGAAFMAVPVVRFDRPFLVTVDHAGAAVPLFMVAVNTIGR